MDRFNIQCHISGKPIKLQFDKKAMPGEAGPCFMITTEGCFKGYISLQKNGSYRSIGANYFTTEDLQAMAEQVRVLVG